MYFGGQIKGRAIYQIVNVLCHQCLQLYSIIEMIALNTAMKSSYTVYTLYKSITVYILRLSLHTSCVVLEPTITTRT